MACGGMARRGATHLHAQEDHFLRHVWRSAHFRTTPRTGLHAAWRQYQQTHLAAAAALGTASVAAQAQAAS